MGRRLRFIPPDGALVEVTCRTLQGRHLLKPSDELNDIVVGVIGRAKRLYPVELCGLVCLSNHLHLLLYVDDAQRLARFMNYVDGNLGKKAGRLHGWHEKFWGNRYHPIVVSDEEAVQVARLKYLLANSVKEELVERPQDWPGVHCATSLLTGEPLKGHWYDRTREYQARVRGKRFGKYDFASEETLTFDPLPCWRHLDPEEYRARVAELVAQVVAEAAIEREVSGTAVMGAARVIAQHPHDAPARFEKTPAPDFHTATREARHQLRTAYALFVAAYRAAADRLKAGDRDAVFPPGSFPPALPFATATAISRPP